MSSGPTGSALNPRKAIQDISAAVPGVLSVFVAGLDTGLIEVSQGIDPEMAAGYLVQVLNTERRALDAAGAAGKAIGSIVFQTAHHYHALLPIGNNMLLGVVADSRQANLAIMMRLPALIGA